MIKGYWKSHGKIPDGKEENRILLSEPPKDHDYVAVYQDDLIIRYDIDDYDHKVKFIFQNDKNILQNSKINCIFVS